MRLATRCPSCTTMFLVVEDQLRVSEGWVRCGRCANVFNAVDDLIDVEQGTPVQLDIDSLQAGTRIGAAHRPDSVGATVPGRERMVIDELDDLDRHDHVHGDHRDPADTPWQLQPADETPPPAPRARPADAPPLAPAPASPGPALARGRPAARPQPPRPEPARADDEADLPDHLLRAPSEQFDDDSVSPSSIGLSQGWSTLTPADGTDAPDGRRAAAPSSLPPAVDEAAPSFVRAAERAQRWKRSPVRTALGVVAGLLLVLAGLQTTLLWRDTVAAHAPGLTPVLQAACAPLGCSVQPLRRIDQLAVDSSGLVRVDDGSDPANHRYRLAVLLHNKAGTALMAPAVELTLTDARGEVVTRRVLQMADFGQPPAPMAAGQDLPLRVLLATGPQRVEGYTVELFYP